MNYIEQQVRVYDDGTTRWYFNGKLHRVDGPAVEFSNGTREWFLYGKRHREDGPAVEDANGYKAWYLYGVKVTEEEHAKRTGKETDTNQAEVVERLDALIKLIEGMRND